MGIIDVVIIALVGLLFLLGLGKGLVKQIFGILAWVAAILVPFLFTNTVIRMFTDVEAGVEFKTSALVFVALFLITFVIVKIIAHFLKSSLNKSAIGFVDSILGGAWGVLKALIIISVVFLAVTWIKDLPFIGEPVYNFVSSDLKLEDEGMGIGKYLYENNLIKILLEKLRARGFEILNLN